jgi:hypothetical protein
MADWVFPMIFLIPLLVGIGYLGWRYINGSTGNGKWKNFAKVLAIVGIIGILWTNSANVMAALGGDETADPPDDGEFTTDYSIDLGIDSTTYDFSGQDSALSQTDEGDATQIFIDDEAMTITMSLTCDDSDGACNFDVASISGTITREDASQWVDGARVTSVLNVKVSPSLTTDGVASNSTAGNPIVALVDRSATSIPAVMFLDGAGAAKSMGDLDVSINEFSPGESVTSFGFYFCIEETDYGDGDIPNGTYGWSWDLTFYDEYGFSATYSVSLSLVQTT